MNQPRLRFTLRHLMIAVAVCAVLLALMPWPLLLVLVPVFGIPLGGSALERARGGQGIIGAVTAGAIGFPACGLGVMIYLGIVREVRVFESPAPWFGMIGLGIVGWAWGMLVGTWAWTISRLRGAADRPVLEPEPAVGPIYWGGFDDRERPGPRPRAGSEGGRPS